MAIEKFRFVSPGVQINEIDDSIITPAAPQIGPVIIGNTAKGPAMQPVMVSSVAELENVFGEPSNGNVGGVDVWRTGTPTSPTLATYAAKAFLQNSSPVTVIRLAGVAGSGNSEPGWQADKVYSLFYLQDGEASLAANIYTSGSTTIQLEGGDQTVVWPGSNGSGSIIINNLTKSFSFNTDSNDYIRNVLNTNPTLYSDSRYNYFLGETYQPTGSFTEMFLTSSVVSASVKNVNGALNAETGYVVDDVESVQGSRGYNCNKLFKFVGLNNGSSLSKDIKISIENVKESKNPAVTKYGTFDVVIRKLFETSTESVLQRFSQVSLDQTADNYIAKVIGDSYREWNEEESRYIEYGTYLNNSPYVRVEMSTDAYPATALPHGFIRKAMYDFDTLSYPEVPSFSHPDIKINQNKYTVSQAKNTRFGLRSDLKTDSELVDILAYKESFATEISGPYAIEYEGGNLFHTRFIKKVGSKIQQTNAYNYEVDVIVSNSSAAVVSGSILGFDMPLYGGFDAKDITKAEPFINNSVDFLSEDTPAYRSIKQAIDMVAQAELIDMNILCIPGLQDRDLTGQMVEVCKARGDALAIIDLEGDYKYAHENSGVEFRPTSVKDAIQNLQSRYIDNSYGAAYFPAVSVPTEGIFMPASVAALGAIGGTEGRSALWFAPAGFNRGGLNVTNSGLNVARTALHLTSADRDALYDVNINPIATFPNEGVVIFGQKTLQSTPSALDRVNVRRLVNYIKKQISRAASRVLFEPNVQKTWNSFKTVVEPFLLSIKNNYGLDDAKVVLDSSTTTADLIDRNIMYCKIYIKPTRAIEYVAIDFVVTNSGAAFTE